MTLVNFEVFSDFKELVAYKRLNETTEVAGAFTGMTTNT